MKAMVQLSSHEVSDLQYPVVVERWMRRDQGIKNRKAWLSTFTEDERALAMEVYKQFYRWYIFSGPTTAVMSPAKLIWIRNKLIPFFAKL